MQSIINGIKSAGRVPILAKVPYVAFAPAADARVQQYNQVINELVANPANNIPVPPPDFHSYFSVHYATQYYPNDSVHPNGIGFQSMAELWLMALEPEL
jgi:lysophospholipase L1-like esterase